MTPREICLTTSTCVNELCRQNNNGLVPRSWETDIIKCEKIRSGFWTIRETEKCWPQTAGCAYSLKLLFPSLPFCIHTLFSAVTMRTYSSIGERIAHPCSIHSEQSLTYCIVSRV